MGGERDLEVRLLLSDKEALTRLHTALKDIESTSKKSTDAMNRGWADVAGAYYLARQAIAPVIGFMREAVNAASAQEDAVNRLNVALANQGIYSAVLSSNLQQMASSLQSSTRYSDEAIMKIEQRLISLGNIAPAQVGRVTKAILDFSTATGKDVESSTMAFVQAANGKTTALGKFGLVIDQTVPKSQKLDEALRLVEQRFGGAASADVNTYSGAVANLDNSWDDFLETLGDFIIKNPKVVEGMHLTKSAVENLTSFMRDHKEDVMDFISAFTVTGATGGGMSIGESIMENIKGMGAALGGIAGAAGSIFSSGPSLVDQLVGTPDQVQTATDRLQQISDDAVQKKQTLEEQLAAIHQSFNEADFQKDLLNNERKLESQRQQIMAWQNEKTASQMAAQQREEEYNQFYLDTMKQAHQSHWVALGKMRDTFSSGMSAIILDMIKGTGNLKQAFADLGMQMIKILVDYAVQWAVSNLIGLALNKAFVAANAPAAAAQAKLWAPAAAMVSLATFGANAIAASAGIISTTATAMGMAALAAVPGLAEGGTITSGGSVLVGERGPELLNLPRAASVIPLGSSSSPIINIVINIYNPSGQIDDDLLSKIKTEVSGFLASELERL